MENEIKKIASVSPADFKAWLAELLKMYDVDEPEGTQLSLEDYYLKFAENLMGPLNNLVMTNVLAHAAGLREFWVDCDIFERLCDKDQKDWTDEEKREYVNHVPCFWVGMAASFLEHNGVEMEDEEDEGSDPEGEEE